MLNILELIFFSLAFTVTFTGILIIKFEKYVPVFVIKGFKYGSFAYKGNSANFLQIIEMPKSHYRHFYLFSSVFSALALIYMYAIYLLNFSVWRYVSVVLRLIIGRDQPAITSSAALLAMFLLTLQCFKRLYETYYLQVFAKSSKMNLSHYLAGLIHYFGCVIAVIGQAPLFLGEQHSERLLTKAIPFHHIPCGIIFLWASYEQYCTNVIFANIRKDKKSGKLVTEDHGVPHGRLFDKVSSPHRLCEIIMYTMLVILVPTRTFFSIYCWVLANQTQTAIQAHEWYKATFKSYPRRRTAVFPKLL